MLHQITCLSHSEVKTIELYKHICAAYRVEPVPSWIHQLNLFNKGLSDFCIYRKNVSEKQLEDERIPASSIDWFAIHLFDKILQQKYLDQEQFPQGHKFFNLTPSHAEYYAYDIYAELLIGLAKLLWGKAEDRKQPTPFMILLLTTTISMLTYKCLYDTSKQMIAKAIYLLVDCQFLKEKIQNSPTNKDKHLIDRFVIFMFPPYADSYRNEITMLNTAELLILDKIEWNLNDLVRQDPTPFLPMLDETLSRTKQLTDQTNRLMSNAKDAFQKYMPSPKPNNIVKRYKQLHPYT